MLDVLHEVFLHHVAPLRELVLVTGHHAEAAAGQHDVEEAGEVGMRLVDPRAQTAQHAGRVGRHPTDLVVDRRHPEVGAPRDPRSAQRRSADRSGERAAVHGIGDRRARVRSRDHREHQREVAHRLRHRALHRVTVPGGGHRVDGDEPRRGAQADHATKGRGDSQRAAEVAALGQRTHAGSERDRAAARRAAARECRVPGISGGAEHRVEGVGAGAVLRRVGLADHDRSRGLQPLDDQTVLVRDVMLEDLRAPRRADPARGREVLDRNGNAVQRPELRASRERAGGRARRGQRLIRGDRAVRVERRVDSRDPIEDRAGQLERRDLPPPDEGDESRGRRETEVVVGHGPPMPAITRTSPRSSRRLWRPDPCRTPRACRSCRRRES